LISISLKNETL
jgi:hypothetical protein